MTATMEMVRAYFDSKGKTYEVFEERNAIRTGYTCEHVTISVIIIFDDNNQTVGLKSFNYVKFPEEKKQKMFEICSKMNYKYRWVKFYVDETDNSVTLSDDAYIDLETCGEEIYELIGRMCGIGDEAYPEFMKTVWS